MIMSTRRATTSNTGASTAATTSAIGFKILEIKSSTGMSISPNNAMTGAKAS